MRGRWLAALALLAGCRVDADRFHQPEHAPGLCPICSLYDSAKYAVVRITTPKGSGSGSLIESKGLVLTNRHVVGNHDEVEVLLYDGRTFRGRVSRRGEGVDLALVQLMNAPPNLPVIPIAAPGEVREGEEIYVIGHPLDLRWTITRGIVSRVRGADDPTMPDWIQIDAPLSPGNSGGPVLNRKGRMVGVATLKISLSGAANLGFACPVGKVREFLGR